MQEEEKKKIVNCRYEDSEMWYVVKQPYQAAAQSSPCLLIEATQVQIWRDSNYVAAVGALYS